MAVIKIKDILEECQLTGRALARVCVQRIQKGDTLDFDGFLAISNSFADEFVKEIIRNMGKEGFRSIKLINIPSLLKKLIDKSLHMSSLSLEEKRKIYAKWRKDSPQNQGNFLNRCPF